MINPGGIPQISGDMDALSGHGSALSSMGSEFSSTGAKVNSTWQSLGGVYDAPEVGQLLAATAPVQSVSASVGEDISAVGRALTSYASEVAQIKAQLDTLRTQAQAFVDENGGDDDWRKDGDKVDQNKHLVEAVNAQVAAFFEAQRRCANTINALYGGQQYTAENGDGKKDPGEYGYTADQLNEAAKEDGALPWGFVDEKDKGFWGEVGDFFVGIKDGAVNMVTDLGALIGRDPTTGDWSWGTAGTAWKGLGTFALAIGVYATPGGMQLDQTIGVPGLGRGALGNTLLNAGKGLIAYDEWGKDKSRAAGMATFNIVSAVVGTKGAGAGLKGAGAAAAGSRIAAVSRAGTVMIRSGEFISKLPTVDSLAARAAEHLPGFKLPDLSHTPDINVPHHVDTPTVHTPETHNPGGHVDTPHVPDAPNPGSVGDSLGRTPDVHTPPVHDTHVPSQHTPSDHTPADHTPADQSPTHTPPESTPPQGAPADHTPGAHTPAGHTPADHTPSDHTPADHTPSDHTPADHTPADHSPSDHTPGDHTPPDHTPGDHTPADHTPGEHTPGDHTPADTPGGHVPDDVPVGTQPDGSWIGEEHGSRFHLNADQNAAADRFLAGSRAAEHEISPQINQVAHGVDGAQLRGYPDFVLKSEDSLKRKLATDLLDNPALTPKEAISGIRDSVRYTIEIPAHNYTDGVLHAVNDLRARGFENVTFKPTWDVPDSYKGLNSTWRDPATGRVFELQFHTPDSFAAKMTTHELYEAQRLPGVSPAEVARLKAEQGEIFRQVHVPADTPRLTELRHELDAERPLAMASVHDGGAASHGTNQAGSHTPPHSAAQDAGHSGSSHSDQGPRDVDVRDGGVTDVHSVDSHQPDNSTAHHTGGHDGHHDQLIAEARGNGLKLDADKVLEIGKDPNGHILWLEEGGLNPRTGLNAGLQHILKEHVHDFGRQGIPPGDIPHLVHKAVTEGEYTGYFQGRPPGRPIFAVQYHGETKYVAVQVGKNGYIVGANPASVGRATVDPRFGEPGYRGW